VKISKNQLSLIIENFLLAEAVHDKAALVVGLTDPEKIEKLRIASEKPHKLQKPELVWLAKYFMSPEGSKSQEPIEDIVAAMKNFYNSKPGLKRVGRSINLQDYNTPSELLSATSFSKGYVHDSEIEKYAHKIFDSKEWQVWLPVTREASCTLGEETTWCTAIKSKGNNLFYNYVMRQGVMLYYVLYRGDKEASKIDDSEAKIALGVTQGNIQFVEEEGEGYGGITVDASNAGVTKNRFISIVNKYSTGDVANDIINKIESHSQSLGGVHPVSEKFEQMLKDPDQFYNENRGKSKDMVLDFIEAAIDNIAAENYDVDQKVLDVFEDLAAISEKDCQPFIKKTRGLDYLISIHESAKSIEKGIKEIAEMVGLVESRDDYNIELIDRKFYNTFNETTIGGYIAELINKEIRQNYYDGEPLKRNLRDEAWEEYFEYIFEFGDDRKILNFLYKIYEDENIPLNLYKIEAEIFDDLETYHDIIIYFVGRGGAPSMFAEPELFEIAIYKK